MENLKKVRELAEKAAREAGKYALSRLGNIKKVSCKGAFTNLVTDVDKKCERIIIEIVKETYPLHSILAEESGQHISDGDWKWIIDPLDGTTNYSHGFPVFAVSIGVAFEKDIKIGVVYDPTRDELFSGVEKDGAYLNGAKIKVSNNRTLEKSLISTGFAYSIKGKLTNLEYFKKMLEKAQAIRRAGAASLDLCYVACGRLDGFWEFDLAPWDTAAGQLIVKESGGKVSKLSDENFDIYEKEVLATNGYIHDEMKNVLTT